MPKMKWWSLSTSVTIALLIGALSIAGQWVSQVLSGSVLEETLRQREIDKVQTLARVVERMIRQKGVQAELVASLVADDQRVGEAMAFEGPERRRRLAALLDNTFRRGEVSALEVVDADEKLVFRAKHPQQFGDVSEIWGVAEALAGQTQLVSSRVSDGVEIRAVEPLRVAARTTGVVVAGVALNKDSLGQMGREIGASLALLDRSGVAIVEPLIGTRSFDATAVTEAFQTKLPVYRVSTESQVTSVYLPILVVDEAYVVLAQLDSVGAYRLLAEGNRRSLLAAGAIGVISVLFGLIVLHLTMRPLRSLRKRAEAIAIDVGGSPIEASDGNEISAIVRVLDSLTSRLIDRNRELSEAKAQSDAASQAKSQFLSTMSHEIRTPLNGVMGLTELLNATDLTAKQRHFTGLIAASGRILHDLLGNAMKFTQHGTVTLRVERLATPPGDPRIWWRMAVEDSGIGIDADDLSRLFQRFSQADASTSRQFGGSGLGLVICKYLVELMEGQLQVRSTPGTGSCFWFDIPFESATPPPVSSPRLSLQDSDPAMYRKILVAEDNQINQLVINGMLDQLGYVVTVVENGQQALDALARETFDLVLLDCQMPVMDGFETVARIRVNERGAGNGHAIPVIALTANALAGDRERCMAAGMTDYLSKPVTQSRLNQVLKRYLAPRSDDTRLHGAGMTLQDDPAGQFDGISIPVESEPATAVHSVVAPATPHQNAGDEAAAVNLTVLDTLRGIDESGGSGLAREVFGIFLQNSVDGMARIEAAVAQRDAAGLGQAAHALKSSAAYVGAELLSDLLGQLEADARKGDMDQAAASLHEVRRQYDRAVSEVSGLDAMLRGSS